MTDTKPEFFDWFEKFIRRNKGHHPQNMTLWYDQVERGHRDLRKFIGGIRIDKEVCLKNQQGKATKAEVDPIIDEILKIVPGYLENYGYTRDIFLEPVIAHGTHNATKTSRHVRTYAEFIFKNSAARENSLKLIDKLLSDLGTIWGRARTVEEKLEVTLSTSPKVFTLLGHLGPDEDSCFRQGSDKTLHKYCLGQTANTFVLVISKFVPEKQKVKQVARAFGFVDPTFSVFSFGNYYFKHGFTEGNAIAAIRAVLEDLWQEEANFYENISFLDDYVWHNPYARWSFAKKSLKTIDRQIMRSNPHLVMTFICPKCGNNGSKNGLEWFEIDDIICCHRCSAVANECEVTHARTFKTLMPLLAKDGNPVFVHPDVANKHKRCNKCNVAHDSDKDICIECEEAYYSECNVCHKLVNDNDLEDFDHLDLTICHRCIDENSHMIKAFLENTDTAALELKL
jgi:hypothetical protein